MLETCPQCGYSLYGLPAEHTCPECGFEYDRYAHVIRIRPYRAVFRVWMGMAWGMLATFLSLWSGFTRFALIVGSLTLAGATEFFLNHFSGRHRQMVVVNHAGMRWLRGTDVLAQLPWDRIGRADYAWMTGMFHIKDPAGQVTFECYYTRFGGPKIARECVRAINELKELYGPDDGPDASPPEGPAPDLPKTKAWP
ncbi:MAG: hypothetical protein D6788_09835 [Planctomycetota bacterium]|nr:MAG: hypothetical protein D6788_09835 [Planctomycetota bacterium]